MDTWIPKNVIEPKTENAESSETQPLMSDAFTSQLRKMIRSEVEAAMSRKLPENSPLPSFQLHFEHQIQLSKPIFTGRKLQDQGISLRVVLRDDSGNVVQAGPMSSIKIKIVALNSAILTGDTDNFEKHVLLGREGKRPLLMGTCEISLSKGVADIDNIVFTDNSRWVRSSQFRLGAKVVGSVHGVTIKEAVSEPFMVKNHRGESYRKMETPGPADEVWRLRRIAKDGKLNGRLANTNINTVDDLRKAYLADADELKKILQVSEKIYKDIVEHAMLGYSNIKQSEYLTGANEGKDQTPPEYENLNDFVNENMFSWGGKPSRWKILSVVLWAIVKMRVLVREKHNMMMLYCLLFGDNYEFEREKVIQLWMAAGFVKEEPLEENGNRIFNIFLDRDYIIPSKVNISRQTRLFKVNLELVSDVFARAESIKGFKMSIEDGDVMANQFADSWHISVQSSNINLATFESLKKFGRLKTLLFLNSSLLTRVASDFFSTFKLLTALDLSGSCITELPSTIQDATELRYVDLSWTEINRLPQSIVYLQKLQTLRLKGCMNLFELPERMQELISLRHLDFDVLGQLNLMPRGIGHLTELRTLPAFIVDEEIINGEKCCNIRELKHMNNLSGELCISGLEQLSSEDAQEAALIDKNRLKYLELRWSDVVNYVQEKELVRVLEDLKPNSCLEELKIICFPGESLPNWIGDEQYQKLVSITLYKCENCSNLPYLGRLPKLKNLEIVEMNGVNQIDHFCGDDKNCAAFPLLEKLSIDGMYSVEAITNGNFACLVKLSLSRCPSLTTLSSFPRCQSLKCVEITDCPLLKYLPEEILSSLLESLVIDACPLLSETYSKGGEHSHEIEHVTNVWIELEQTQSSDECSTEDDSSTKDAHSDDMLDEDD